jgi:Lysozyme like domain
LNIHQNIRMRNTYKLSVLVKLSLVMLFSLIVLTATVSFNSGRSLAATVHLDAQKSLVASTIADAHKPLANHTSKSENKPPTAVVSFVAPKTVAASNVAGIIHQVFGSYANQAMHIAMCESNMNPNANNSDASGNSHPAGLFQILYPSTWSGTAQAQASPYNATANTKAAFEIFTRDGYSWGEWQCQP